MSRIVIFANGNIPSLDRMREQLLPDDQLIAADGGYHHLKVMRLLPKTIIGDMDSVDPGDVEYLKSAGVQVIEYPAAKDETDLELALGYAIRQGAAEIMIAGALGGRIDQTLGNIHLLGLSGTANRRVWLEDGNVALYFIRKELILTGKPGETLSLIPCYGPACGVTTSGLQYPLLSETLYPEKTRGISNVFEHNTISVSITGGNLLCIHTHTF
jgi:thiamine pyrophosphokinase